MKKIVAGLIAVLLLLGGGVFFLNKSGDGAGAETEPEVEVSQSKISLDEVHIYMNLEPITATIFRENEAAGVFTTAVTLELSEEKYRTEIILVRRRLRDAMFRELHAMFEREEYTGRKVSVDAVKQRMLVVTRRELGEEVVVDLFIKTLLRKGA
jgi:flagellar basal body-associated protein FliL